MNTSYPLMMKIMHWSVGPLILGVLIVGFLMTNVLPDSIRYDFYDWHKSFGLTVFALALLRIIVRLLSHVPPMDPAVRPHERLLAKGVYAAFYILMVAFPLSGYIMSVAGGHPVAWFGISIPSIMSKNLEIAGIARELHEIFGYTLAALIVMHVGGVIVHWFRDGINIVRRMI